MKLTPVEILTHLGFVIPEDGIEINPDDTFYFASALSLLGKTLSVENISDDALHMRHVGLLGAHGNFVGVDPEVDHNEAEKSRATMRIALSSKFGLTV